jgi:hypothetical protein
VFGALVLEVDGGVVRRVDLVVNPEKPGRVVAR